MSLPVEGTPSDTHGRPSCPSWETRLVARDHDRCVTRGYVTSGGKDRERSGSETTLGGTDMKKDLRRSLTSVTGEYGTGGVRDRSRDVPSLRRLFGGSVVSRDSRHPGVGRVILTSVRTNITRSTSPGLRSWCVPVSETFGRWHDTRVLYVGPSSAGPSLGPCDGVSVQRHPCHPGRRVRTPVHWVPSYSTSGSVIH